MAGKPKRLSKVTKEFNLGLNTVVDYLVEKGFEVENNPNAKISPDMYDALSEEFQTEKKVKEKSNKIEVKKPIKETISIEEEKQEPPKVEEESSEAVVEIKEVEPPKPNPEVKKEIEDEKGGLKVLGKIDLGKVEKKVSKKLILKFL